MTTRSQRRRLFLAILFVALAFAGLAIQRPTRAPRGAAAASASASRGGDTSGAPTPPASYETTLAELTKQKHLTEVLADAAPGSWSRRAKAAAVELSYAQLTGDYDVYAQADRSLAEAFRAARSGIDDESLGPHLLEAQLDYELHRLKPALAAMRVPEEQAETLHDHTMLADLTSLRGAIHFQLGDYDTGLAELRKSVEMEPSTGHAQRLAIALAKVGADDQASRIFDETEKKTTTPRGLAWLSWQRAKIALEHGRRDEGRRQLGRALGFFPGFWQVEEQLAELDAEEGRTEVAIASYRRLVDKTHDPEFMDALAALVRESDPAEAQRLLDRSNAIYEDRLVKLPEASYGHALEHFLKMVADPARAVEIAEKNVALRPNGEARTRLAQAYVRAGRIADAGAEMNRVLASRWVSSESYATAALVLRLAGDPAAAEMQARAVARNPHAMSEIDWLVTSRS